MKISLIAIGTKMPSWVIAGYSEYAERLPKEFSLQLIEIPAKKRGIKGNIKDTVHNESEQLFANIPSDNHVVALDRSGKTLATTDLASKLYDFYQQSQDLSLLVGGPEGISLNFLQKAHELWSLSALTLPHPLVRVVVAEQIYRAWSIITKHPYHR